jgi:DNA-binding MarR family transcriptional regulator
MVADVDSIHRSIAHLQRLSDLLGERRRQLAASVGLSEQQWRVLEEISTEHFIPSLFAKSRDSSAAAVSKVLRQLLDKGVVRVSVSNADGRQRNYELTSKGRSTMERLRKHRQRAIDAIWSELSSDELARFNRFGAELIARIERFAALEENQAAAPRSAQPAATEVTPSARSRKSAKAAKSTHTA